MSHTAVGGIHKTSRQGKAGFMCPSETQQHPDEELVQRKH